MEVGKKFNGLKEDLGNSISYMYVVKEVPEHVDGDDTEFRELLSASGLIPPYENNIKLTNIQIGEQLTNTCWLVTAEYKADNKNFPNQSSMTFDTGGATAHKSLDITLLDSAINKDGEMVQNPMILNDFMPIGFNGEDVEGVDIIISSYKFTETHPLPDSVLTPEFKNNLFKLTGTVNKDPFREFEAGEVLFTGVSGSKNGNEKYILTYNFEALPNKRNFEINGYNIVLKRGWEYLAVRFSKQLSDEKDRVIAIPLQVDVHKVYETTDFSLLGIGTGTWDEINSQNQQNGAAILMPFGN